MVCCDNSGTLHSVVRRHASLNSSSKIGRAVSNFAADASDEVWFFLPVILSGVSAIPICWFYLICRFYLAPEVLAEAWVVADFTFGGTGNTK